MNTSSASQENAHLVALVTGSGAPRVGNVIVRTLAEQGYSIVVHAHKSLASAEQTVAELRSAGTQAIALAADLADEHAVEQLVQQAREHFGRIDALVNCAAIWQRIPLEKTTAEQVRRHFEINTLGHFSAARR